MGMAASQARLLSLQARQSNLEYQGQQINQERTILSQQCTALYNSLLAMTVPTPPSTSDFTAIEYSGADGATTFSLGNIVPTGDTYTVELKYQKTGQYIEEKGSAAVTHVPQYLIMTPVEVPQSKATNYIAKPESTIGTSTVPEGADVMCKVDGAYELQGDEKFYELKNGKFLELADKSSATSSNNLYVKRKAVNAIEGSEGTEGTPANFTSSDYLLTGAETGTLTSGGLTASELSDYYICSGNTITEITPEMLNDTTKFTKLDDGT